MRSLFQHREGSPFHISVGAVVINDAGKILTHKRTQKTTPAQFLYTIDGLEEVYTLMRESLEENESLESATLRGVREEFGIEGKIEKYLGSYVGTIVPEKGVPYEKTTLYFSVQVINQGERPMDDGEAHSELLWVDPKDLIEKMIYQGANTIRTDIDESKIVEAYLKNL